jgi:hypothetical protein
MESPARCEPRLWIERLLITRSTNPLEAIRDISLHPGLNIVWAKEPASREGLSTLQRAGHGVGKSTLCLMFRCILGDGGKAVKAMRDQLASQFPNGGIGALVHFAGCTYSVYRPFASDGYAARHGDLEALLDGGDHIPFKQYLDALSEAMLVNLQQRQIPGSEQTIEWPHVLSWVTRDQGTRLRSYYDWRSTEGSGLQRARQAPPWVLRAVLGLTNTQEMEAARAVESLARKLKKAEEEAKGLEGAPRLIRARIEASLRSWLDGDADLELHSDDMFKSSVMKELKKQTDKTEAAVAKLDEQIIAVEAQAREQDRAVDEAKGIAESALLSFGEAEAMRDRDEVKVKSLQDQLSKLRGLQGPCRYGAVEFQSCEHIRKRLETRSFHDGRDQKAIQSDIEYWTAEAIRLLPAKNAAQNNLARAETALSNSMAEIRKLRVKRDSRRADLYRPQLLKEELTNWEDAFGAASSPELAAKRAELRGIQESHDLASASLLEARNGQIIRESQMTQKIDALAQAFDLHGRFLLNNDERPFELVGSAGEAYSVLEILLGDFACALDAVDNPASSFPAFLLHDCPREADLSGGLYSDYLSTVAEKGAGTAAWQMIVTTTTPPPADLRKPPHLVLELHPESHEGLLLRSRFGLQAHIGVSGSEQGQG